MTVKAFALVVREVADRRELLIFDHPLTRPQIPKGTVEPGERPDEAVLRELDEESGVTAVQIVAQPAVLHRTVPKGRTGRGDHLEMEEQAWHLFLLRPTADLPERWSFAAGGAAEEAEQLVYTFRWLPLDGAAAAEVEPVQAVCVEVARRWGR